MAIWKIQEKKEPKKEKTLALKVSKSKSSKEDEDVSYLAQIFIRDMKKNERFHKNGNTNKSSSGSDYWHECGKLGHFIKDCPMHKVEYKYYVKDGGDKGK